MQRTIRNERINEANQLVEKCAKSVERDLGVRERRQTAVRCVHQLCDESQRLSCLVALHESSQPLCQVDGQIRRIDLILTEMLQLCFKAGAERIEC